MTVADALAQKPVSDLDLSRHVRVSPEDTVETTIDRMSAAGYSCALIVEDERMVGIFTEHEVLMKVVGDPDLASQPIADLMLSEITTIEPTRSVAEALSIINERLVRNVPVVGGGDQPQGTTNGEAPGPVHGNVSSYVVMKVIASLVADHSLATPTEVSAHHGLELIDFTGLNTPPTVTVHADDPLETAVRQMKYTAIGSVFVVDQRDSLVGLITEFDLQARRAWLEPDLTAVTVADYMTPDPVAVSARSPIAEAIQKMASGGFTHLPLVGESGRPIGVASFRDITDYFERTVDALE